MTKYFLAGSLILSALFSLAGCKEKSFESAKTSFFNECASLGSEEECRCVFNNWTSSYSERDFFVLFYEMDNDFHGIPPINDSKKLELARFIENYRKALRVCV